MGDAPLIDPAELAATVAAAAKVPGASRALLLDVDGTLAPIAPTPEQARVPSATLEALRRLIERGWTVAPVSGRPLAQICEMIPLLGIAPFGSHGLESSVETPDTLAIDAGSRRRLERLKQEAGCAAQGFAGVRVELKPAGIAFHDRALDPAQLIAWHDRVSAWLSERSMEGLEVLRGKRVVEVRAAGGDKGIAVRAIASRSAVSHEDRSFVAIGDDVTDEDMFRAMCGAGLAVRVGLDREPTAAALRLASPEAVRRFLELLATEA